METLNYIFCSICGTYAKQLRRSQLHSTCPRKPRNRFAGLAIKKLMTGLEPVGRSWERTSEPAKQYVAD